ncbi:MAG: NusG domain II-containing protein [Clostridia bacterium]|nr:NusG domain II-containing protein [Clostridia bacterium]
MEQKRFDKKNLLVLGAVIVLIVIVTVIAATQKRELNPTLGPLEADATAAPVVTEAASAVPVTTAAPEATEAPESTEAPASTEEPAAANEPAQAYLVVSVAGAMYEPIPLYEEGRYTVKRGDLVNTIEVTPDSIKMHASSCDNQDCVEQGVVSLENRSKRVLQNMIICLPNEVVLELYTPEEIAALLLSMAGYTGEEGNE